MQYSGTSESQSSVGQSTLGGGSSMPVSVVSVVVSPDSPVSPDSLSLVVSSPSSSSPTSSSPLQAKVRQSANRGTSERRQARCMPTRISAAAHVGERADPVGAGVFDH